MVGDDKSLRIACRHVCTDQWLITHVDPSWTIASLKLFILHRFSRTLSDSEENPRAISVSPRKARRRSLSPITFAPPTLRKSQPLYGSVSSSGESTGSEDLEDEDFDDDDDDDDVNITKVFTDAHRYKYNTRPSTSTTSDTARLPQDVPTDADTNAYVFLTFSTTQVLEDRFSLAWYGIHPGELLELHPAGVSFVSLSRGTLDTYIEPYFATRVWALRIVGHGSDDRADDHDGRRKKKVTVEWKERWAVIHQGVFSLCKERHDMHPAFSAPLSSMLSIRDSAHFKIPLHTSRIPGRHKPSSSLASSNIVCIKFGTGLIPRNRTFSNELATSDPSTSFPNYAGSGQGSWWRRGSRDVSTTLSMGLTSSASALVGSAIMGSSTSDVWDSLARRGSRAGLDDSEGEPEASREKGKGRERDEGEDAVWIVLDMLASSACSHILRILHRHAPPECNSTFLPGRSASIYSPSPSPIIFNSRSSTPGSPTTPGPSHNTFQAPLNSPNADSPPPPYVPYKAYHFGPGNPSSNSPPSSPTVAIPDWKISHSQGVPYPFWRIELVRDARRAGLGAVGRAMELVMFGDEEGGEDEYADDEGMADDELDIEWARPRRGTESSLGISPIVDQLPYGADLFGDSEMEPSADPTAHPAPTYELTSPYGSSPPSSDSDLSEAEWEGWVDAVLEQYRQESLARRAQARREALAASGSVPVSASTSSAPWPKQWASRYSEGEPASDVAKPEREHEHVDYSELGAWRWPGQRGSDAEGSVEESSQSHQSSDLHAPPSAYSARRATLKGEVRGRGHGRSGSTGRRLSSYSSVDSLLRRTVTAGISLNQARRSSMQALFSSASSSDVNLQRRRSGSLSPPLLHTSLSRSSVASFRSTSNANVRNHTLSPLSTQLPDADAEEGDAVTEQDVDDVEEAGDAPHSSEDFYESELGHGQDQGPHPVPLPGMRMVPAGYTTFQHNALYGGGQASDDRKRSGERAPVHAGVVHGQSVGRLPMGSMVTTVSSTVSVGPSARRSGKK